MSKYCILLILLGLMGCGMFSPHTRPERYMVCVKDLYREGISEQRLKLLCDSIIDNRQY